MLGPLNDCGHLQRSTRQRSARACVRHAGTPHIAGADELSPPDVSPAGLGRTRPPRLISQELPFGDPNRLGYGLLGPLPKPDGAAAVTIAKLEHLDPLGVPVAEEMKLAPLRDRVARPARTRGHDERAIGGTGRRRCHWGRSLRSHRGCRRPTPLSLRRPSSSRTMAASCAPSAGGYSPAESLATSPTWPSPSTLPASLSSRPPSDGGQ